MACNGELNFYGFALFLCVTSVLTLTVNNETGANHLLEDTVHINTAKTIPKVENSTFSGLSNSSSTLNNTTIIQNSTNAPGPVPMEGGGSFTSKSTELKSVTTISSTTSKIESDEENISRGREMGSVIQKSSVQKIFPRKGADQMLHRETEASPKETKSSTQEKDQKMDKSNPVIESGSGIIINNNSNDNNNGHTDVSQTNNASMQSDNTSNIANSSSMIASEKKTTNITTLKPDVTSKKHKPKPTATVGGSDIDKPIPASPTKSVPLGMPSKIDYIVPVVITIIALPILGAIAFIMYSRGRDCWDKRHYRRMDFLIDGMYND